MKVRIVSTRQCHSPTRYQEVIARGILNRGLKVKLATFYVSNIAPTVASLFTTQAVYSLLIYLYQYAELIWRSFKDLSQPLRIVRTEA